jgi:hypothetical protein
MFYKIYQIIPVLASLAQIAGNLAAKVAVAPPPGRDRIQIAFNPFVGQSAKFLPERAEIQPPSMQTAIQYMMWG